MFWIIVGIYLGMVLLHALLLRNRTTRELIINGLNKSTYTKKDKNNSLIIFCWLWFLFWIGFVCCIIYYCTIGLILKAGTALIRWVANI